MPEDGGGGGEDIILCCSALSAAESRLEKKPSGGVGAAWDGVTDRERSSNVIWDALELGRLLPEGFPFESSFWLGTDRAGVGD